MTFGSVLGFDPSVTDYRFHKTLGALEGLGLDECDIVHSVIVTQVELARQILFKSDKLLSLAVLARENEPMTHPICS